VSPPADDQIVTDSPGRTVRGTGCEYVRKGLDPGVVRHLPVPETACWCQPDQVATAKPPNADPGCVSAEWAVHTQMR